jgi:hypothetical protein
MDEFSLTFFEKLTNKLDIQKGQQKLSDKKVYTIFAKLSNSFKRKVNYNSLDFDSKELFQDFWVRFYPKCMYWDEPLLVCSVYNYFKDLTIARNRKKRKGSEKNISLDTLYSDENVDDNLTYEDDFTDLYVCDMVDFILKEIENEFGDYSENIKVYLLLKLYNNGGISEFYIKSKINLKNYIAGRDSECVSKAFRYVKNKKLELNEFKKELLNLKPILIMALQKYKNNIDS